MMSIAARRRRFKISRLFIYAGVIVFLVYMLGPIYVMVITSMTPERDQLLAPPAWIPSQIDLTSYLNILFRSDLPQNVAARGFSRSLLNTFLVASGVTIVSVTCGSLAAYAYARLRLPLRDKLVLLVLFTELLPAVVIVIPLFLRVEADILKQ